MSFKSKNFGYSLVEMILYTAIVFAISTALISMLITFSSTYRTLGALRIAEHSGIDAMERMTRDIRAAKTVTQGSSTLGSSPGVLTIVSTATTTKFYIQGGILKVDVNGSYFGPLTLSSASVSNLVFTLLSSGISDAIKIDMTVSGTVGATTKTKNYRSTVILKGQ